MGCGEAGSGSEEAFGLRAPGAQALPNPLMENALSKSEERQKPELIQARLDKNELKKLDNMRRKEEDIPSRAEMIRRLINRAS